MQLCGEICAYIHIYIYIYRERERKRESRVSFKDGVAFSKI